MIYSPTCPNCASLVKKGNKFCNSKCSAEFNNAKRAPRSTESRSKTASTLRGRPNPRKGQKVGPKQSGVCGIKFLNCKICDKAMCLSVRSSRTTCSRSCQTEAVMSGRTYQNGKRKLTKYFNVSQNKSVTLESSWEVEIAELLDKHQITWIRPSPLTWDDSSGKQHSYFPDFYLPDWKVYLDPKNPYGMDQDKEKMAVISKSVNIVFGDLQLIKDYILSRWSESN